MQGAQGATMHHEGAEVGRLVTGIRRRDDGNERSSIVVRMISRENQQIQNRMARTNAAFRKETLGHYLMIGCGDSSGELRSEGDCGTRCRSHCGGGRITIFTGTSQNGTRTHEVTRYGSSEN